MKIYLVDRNKELVDCWKEDFAGHSDVVPLLGDIWQQPAQAIVSPANSFGFMDGGIDQIYTNRFGWQLQDNLQKHIRTFFYGELPVGQATVVDTGDKEFPFLISAPTMIVPSYVYDTTNAFLAFRAALHVAVSNEFTSIVCPGLGTGVGRIPYSVCSQQMLRAYRHVIHRKIPYPPSLGHAAFEVEMTKSGTKLPK